MDQITSLTQLIETLHNCNPKDYVKIAASMDLSKDEFEDYAFWNDDCYARNCIERTEDFELILICWNPGDKTPVHGHNEQKCWVYQVEGNMYEERFKDEDGELVPCNQMELVPGRLSYMEDHMGYHTLENRSSDNSMTLHLYISPIDYCKVFDSSENEFCEKELNYDSYKGVLMENLVS